MSVEHVVIKAFRGIALNRWLIGTTGEVALITNDEGADAARSGLDPRYALGFPKGDIYVPDERGVADGSTPNWAEMRPRF